MSSTRAEAETLICRFLAADLPLFALQAWLLEADNGLDPALSTRLLALDWQAPELWSQLEAQLAAVLPAGKAQGWELQQLLSWILSAEPRACWAVAQCQRLYAGGLRFLAPIAEAMDEGQLPNGFDWEPIRALIPELAPAAELLLHVLASGELQLQAHGYLLEASTASLLESQLESAQDWRRANQAIALWLDAHRHLVARPSEPGA